MSWTVTEEIQSLLGKKLERLESPSLRLEKMLFMQKKQNFKEQQIDAVVKCHNSHAVFPRLGFADMPSARRFIMQLRGRLLVNHAGGILENTGLCLHRHFGCPYIPGTAIKGIARHQAWIEWREALDGTAEKRSAALKLALVFGFPAGDPVPKKKGGRDMNRPQDTDFLDHYLVVEFPELFGPGAPKETFGGTVCFLPAFPVTVNGKRPRLAKDITTCHHSNYYRGKQPAAFDNEQPNVLPFPVVESGVSFEFALKPGSRAESVQTHAATELPQPFDPLAFAEKCLRTGLQDHGLGAKTAAGYGWFTEDTATEQSVEAARRAALQQEEERRRGEAEKRREKDRLEQLSPEDRRAEELGAMDDDDFKGYLWEVETKDDTEKRAVVKAVLKQKKHIWLADRNGKRKAAKRAEIMKRLAEEFGEQLP